MTDKQAPAKEVYYIVAVDDDYKPVHTTRICSDLKGAQELRDLMAQSHHDVLICGEIS